MRELVGRGRGGRRGSRAGAAVGDPLSSSPPFLSSASSGAGLEKRLLGDLFSFDCAALRWAALHPIATGPAPPPRSASSLARAGGLASRARADGREPAARRARLDAARVRASPRPMDSDTPQSRIESQGFRARRDKAP